MLDQRSQWIAPAGEIVLHAAQYQRAAMAFARGAYGAGIQPDSAHDARIEFAFGLVLAQFSAKGETQVGHGRIRPKPRPAPAVDADQFGRLEMPGRLLQHLAPATLHQRLVLLQMSGRLVVHDPAFILFLDQKELPAALDHRSYRDARSRAHGGSAAVVADEVRHARDAVLDRLIGRGIGETDVLPLAGHARAEMDVREHCYPGFVQQAFAQLFGVLGADHAASLGDIGPGVEPAPGQLAAHARHPVQQAHDQVAPGKETRAHFARLFLRAVDSLYPRPPA